MGDLDLLIDVAKKFEVVRIVANRNRANDLVKEVEKQGFRKVQVLGETVEYQKIEGQKCIAVTIEWKYYPIVTVEVKNEIKDCDISLLIDLLNRCECKEVN